MNILKLIKDEKVEYRSLGEVSILKRGRVISKKTLEEEKGEFPVYSSKTLNNGEIGKIKTYDFDGEYLTWTTDGAYAGSIFYRNEKFSITNICGLIDVKDKTEINIKYLYYYLKINSKKYVKGGSGNPKLMSNSIEKIKIPIPQIKTQEEIVEILDKFTEYSTELEAELEAELVSRTKQYEFFRDKLLSLDYLNKKSKEFGYDEVLLKKLGEVVKTVISPVKIKTNEYQSKGETPIIDQGKNFISAYINNVDCIPKGEYIIFGDHSENIKYVDFPFIQGADGLKILIPKDNSLKAKYIYYCLKNFYKKENIYKRHWKKAKETLIPIPPMQVQEYIVERLDKFESIVNDISFGIPYEIELRTKQYEYYRDKLLSFN